MTAALATTQVSPSPIRVLPAPQSEPPYDDEVASRPHSVTSIGQRDAELPLDWGRRPHGRPGRRQRAGRPAGRTAS
ncbi:MAG: hypothetical protein ACRDT6_29180, partial [Micromonosporaceae bacterium]